MRYMLYDGRKEGLCEGKEERKEGKEEGILLLERKERKVKLVSCHLEILNEKIPVIYLFSDQ